MWTRWGAGMGIRKMPEFGKRELSLNRVSGSSSQLSLGSKPIIAFSCLGELDMLISLRFITFSMKPEMTAFA